MILNFQGSVGNTRLQSQAPSQHLHAGLWDTGQASGWCCLNAGHHRDSNCPKMSGVGCSFLCLEQHRRPASRCWTRGEVAMASPLLRAKIQMWSHGWAPSRAVWASPRAKILMWSHGRAPPCAFWAPCLGTHAVWAPGLGSITEGLQPCACCDRLLGVQADPVELPATNNEFPHSPSPDLLTGGLFPSISYCFLSPLVLPAQI